MFLCFSIKFPCLHEPRLHYRILTMFTIKGLKINPSSLHFVLGPLHTGYARPSGNSECKNGTIALDRAVRVNASYYWFGSCNPWSDVAKSQKKTTQQLVILKNHTEGNSYLSLNLFVVTRYIRILLKILFLNRYLYIYTAQLYVKYNPTVCSTLYSVHKRTPPTLHYTYTGEDIHRISKV